MLGYGGTQKPIEASDYSSKKICADLAALLDLLEIKCAVCMKETVHNDSMLIFSQVIIGHDWGSFIVGRFALWYPNRILALAS
jgi:soluble epoxide hydrolase/lipid-phosphate phosphatase